MKFIAIGEYCQKIVNILQNMQNWILVEQKKCKNEFIAYLGVSGFKKNELFINLGM